MLPCLGLQQLSSSSWGSKINNVKKKKVTPLLLLVVKAHTENKLTGN